MGQSGIKPDKFVNKNYTVRNSNMMMMKKVKYLKQTKIKSVDLAETKKSYIQYFVVLIINIFELLIERDFKILL